MQQITGQQITIQQIAIHQITMQQIAIQQIAIQLIAIQLIAIQLIAPTLGYRALQIMTNDAIHDADAVHDAVHHSHERSPANGTSFSEKVNAATYA